MAYTNSKLVDYTKLSPNNSGQRTHSIDRITIHCVVGQCSVETLGNIFAPVSRQASSNYGIGPDGRVGLYCEEKNRSWCSSSSANDQRAITIEVASDTYAPYAVNEKAYNATIELCADICKRNGKSKLIWLNDKEKSLAYEPKADEMIMTAHRWFSNTICPGEYLYSRFDDIAKKVTAKLAGSDTEKKSEEKKEEKKSTKFPNTPFLVEVLISNLNIRQGAGTNYKTAGRFTGKGKFTITEVNGDWGKLKSGIGWIYIANSAWVKIGKTVLNTETVSSKKSVDEIAKEVIAGKWYNGAARKNALEKAGYDYATIQKRVNELLK